MRRKLRGLLARCWRALAPSPTPEVLNAQNRIESLESQLIETKTRELQRRATWLDQLAEFAEAQTMRGIGPWLPAGDAQHVLETAARVGLRESTNPIVNQGSYGDIQLALSNVEWRREVNLSWLEFSRWGVQQIILICRLHYIKNPIIRRLIDVASVYVFGRGVEISSSDEDANDALQEFFAANVPTMGQVALTEMERRRWYDGNLFWCFFQDKLATGKTNVRLIDATEIQEVICDPDDAAKPWYYKREWTAKVFDPVHESVKIEAHTAWYPALGYDPPQKPAKFGTHDVMWSAPVYHRKDGAVANWQFGCPKIYPAIDWAKASKLFLEACQTVKMALSQFAMTLTTKGGQQALEGAKQQLQTTVGPTSSLWDQNPPAVKGSIFASGPGTTLSAFNSKGAGADPEEVRQYKLMCCMVAGVPETFLADVSTGNLATATTLDRPTELGFLERQESWREDLVVICTEVLKASLAAPKGKLREAIERRRADAGKIVVREAKRVRGADGRWIYERAEPKTNEIDVRVEFPAIREGDIPALVTAAVSAMTLNNKGGQITGIDEKEGVRKLGTLIGIEDVDEMVEAMYPESEYDPDRTKEPEAAPIGPATPTPGGQPQPAPNAIPQPQAAPGTKQPTPAAKEARARVNAALEKLVTVVESMNGQGA